MFSNFTPKAKQSLFNLMDDYSNDLNLLVNNHTHDGICTSCGEISSGVEPDAEGYLCKNCGNESITGIEHALISEA